MSGKVAHADYFKKALYYSKVYDFIFYTSLIIVSIMGFLDKDNIADICSIALVMIIVIIEKIRDSYHFKGEEVRRKGFFDNSFQTRFNEVSSEQYYDTDEVSYGVYKMAVNLFENSLYTREIVGKMKKKVGIINLVFFAIVVAFALYGIARANFAIPIVQLFLSKECILNWYDINVYYNRVDNIFEELKHLFDQRLRNTKESIEANTAEIIKLYVEYETNIADEKILLDSKIYNEVNDRLMQEWEDMKIRYEIK